MNFSINILGQVSDIYLETMVSICRVLLFFLLNPSRFSGLDLTDLTMLLQHKSSHIRLWGQVFDFGAFFLAGIFISLSFRLNAFLCFVYLSWQLVQTSTRQLSKCICIFVEYGERSVVSSSQGMTWCLAVLHSFKSTPSTPSLMLYVFTYFNRSEILI